MCIAAKHNVSRPDVKPLALYFGTIRVRLQDHRISIDRPDMPTLPWQPRRADASRISSKASSQFHANESIVSPSMSKVSGGGTLNTLLENMCRRYRLIDTLKQMELFAVGNGLDRAVRSKWRV